jgi:signal peptidase I
VHNFRVLLYPRGGASLAKNKPLVGEQKEEDQTSGFGMSYKILPMIGSPAERVGVYLQYLPTNGDDSVDVTFDLRLRGQQTSGRKFDLEFNGGMRFTKEGKLSEGTASDFGAHLMQTPLLEEFMGAEQGSEMPLQVSARLTVHPELARGESEEVAQRESKNQPFGFNDIRLGSNGLHNTNAVRVGKVVVPLLQNLKDRPRMFEVGAYPGVEYRILRIFSEDGHEIFGSAPGSSYELKPIYPLVDALERQWPVSVQEAEIPRLYTANMYNAISALGSLFTAVFGLLTAFIVSQAVSLFFIPSRSMDPTLQIGDVLVVEKVSPRVLKGNNHKGDVVLFHPPSLLQEIVSANGGRITDRDLFVKRVAAEPGDIVKVDASGAVTVNGEETKEGRDLCEAEPLRLIERYVRAGETKIKDGEVFVMGDCSSVSVDSRVWGPLSNDEIVGKPLVRAWPFNRFGSIASLPTPNTEDWRD